MRKGLKPHKIVKVSIELTLSYPEDWSEEDIGDQVRRDIYDGFSEQLNFVPPDVGILDIIDIKEG